VVEVSHSSDGTKAPSEKRVREVALEVKKGSLLASSDRMRTVLYKRATFVTHLPVEHLFTPSHSWLSRVPEIPNLWRVGYTKFALRMLGDMVDIQLEKKGEDAVAVGDVIGSIEGFKAISDLYSVANGRFLRGNPEHVSKLEAITEKPYDSGWLYEVEGEPDSRALDVDGYRDLLDATIDRLLQKEQESKAQP
jgi:glycine cleavage system H protein